MISRSSRPPSTANTPPDCTAPPPCPHPPARTRGGRRPNPTPPPTRRLVRRRDPLRPLPATDWGRAQERRRCSLRAFLRQQDFCGSTCLPGHARGQAAYLPLYCFLEASVESACLRSLPPSRLPGKGGIQALVGVSAPLRWWSGTASLRCQRGSFEAKMCSQWLLRPAQSTLATLGRTCRHPTQ